MKEVSGVRFQVSVKKNMRAKSLNLNIEIQHLVTACNLLKD
jgi:hypothetical protein